MNQKIFASILFLFSLFTIFLSYLLIFYPFVLNLCERGYSNCLSENILLGIASPFYWSTYLLPPFFLGLIFIKKEIFWAWVKFIPWFALPALLLIIVSPTIDQPFQMTPGRTSVTETMVQLIVGLSVLFIAFKYWRLRRK